jgi:hypothetical protein
MIKTVETFKTVETNYLLELPEDIHTLIYKKLFNNSLKIIAAANSKSLYDFYDLHKKSKLSYCISNINDIYLQRNKFIKKDISLQKLKYIEYPISYCSKRFQYIKKVFEDFAPIIYDDDNDERINFKLQRKNSGINKIQYKNNNTFRLFIDKNKMMCKADLEKAIILGYDLIYYSLKLIKNLKLNQYDYYKDFTNLCEWATKYHKLDGYDITQGIVSVKLGF